jgi:hypothetical protein
MKRQQIPLSEAALQLGLDYQQCRRLMLRGVLRGGRDEFGRLYVKRTSLERLQRMRDTPRDGRKEADS